MPQCGILYALIGGQPMMINGGTGPVLAFTAVLYNLSKTMEVPFLTLNAWTGLWVGLYMMIAAVFGLNKYILLCTRFTDEIFSTLSAHARASNRRRGAAGSPHTLCSSDAPSSRQSR